MRGNRFAFFVTLGIVIIAGALASHAAACVAAGHGGIYNCDLPAPPDTSQHCFVGKERPTPKIGSTYAIDVTAYIEPISVFPLVTPCTGRADSAWVMSDGTTTLPGEQNAHLVQVGYWYDCSWGTLDYFQTTYDGAWHNTLLWPWTNGAGRHLFTVRRTPGTNNFQSYIDGYAYFAPVTVSNAYARQDIMVENTVPNSRSAICNRARFRFGAVASGPPGNYQFPWFEAPTTFVDPGMNLSSEHGDGTTTDWWDGSDWAT